MYDPEQVYTGICWLGEGPLWNVREQRLYWTDILNSRLWVYDPAGGSSSVFWEGAHQVGGFAFSRSGGLVLCTDKGVFALNPEQMGQSDARPKLLHEVDMAPGELFNDITVDPAGRIFAGTYNSTGPTGTLYRLEKGRPPETVLTGLGCSNGMTFSMDERFFYHTDTIPGTITRYAYDRDTGRISDPRIIFKSSPGPDGPDGLTLDREDHLWAAFWGGSVVRRLSPAGSIVEEIRLPVKQPSSVMFGGADLRDLYITSACEGGSDLERGLDSEGVFLGGPVYRVRLETGGRPEWLADY